MQNNDQESVHDQKHQNNNAPNNFLHQWLSGICYDFYLCLPYLDLPYFFFTNPRCHNDIIMTSFTYDITPTSL